MELMDFLLHGIYLMKEATLKLKICNLLYLINI